MAKGDHLTVCFGLYHHHGLDLGDGNVIHYGRGLHDLKNAKIEIVSMEDFAKGNKIRNSSAPANFDSDTIIERAHSRLGENCYDVFDNNCEHFVNWCRVGQAISTQISATKTLLRQTAAIASRSLVRKGVGKAVTRGGPGAPLILADLLQAGAELLAMRNGSSAAVSEKIGSRVGAVSSAGIGMAIGGPVGAASGLGLWAAGQVFGREFVDKGEAALRNQIGEQEKE